MTRIASLLLSLALLAAACGSDDAEPTVPAADPTTTTTAPTTTTTTTTIPAPTTFVGADGVESVITDASRIISLNGDITEVLFELGVGDQVIAIDVTTTYPPEAQSLPPVGFAQGLLAAEPILGLGPTLVIGDIRVGPPEVLTQIRDAGVPVTVIPYETSLDSIRTKIETLAQIVGEEPAGAELASRVESSLDAAFNQLSGTTEPPSVAFVYARGPEALLLFGPGSPSSELIRAAGAVDAVQGPPFGPLTPEALAAASPDVIITTEGALGALGGVDAFLTLPGVAQTPAGSAARILAYDEAAFLGLGPRTGAALSQLIEDLYAEQAPS